MFQNRFLKNIFSRRTIFISIFHSLCTSSPNVQLFKRFVRFGLLHNFSWNRWVCRNRDKVRFTSLEIVRYTESKRRNARLDVEDSFEVGIKLSMRQILSAGPSRREYQIVTGARLRYASRRTSPRIRLEFLDFRSPEFRKNSAPVRYRTSTSDTFSPDHDFRIAKQTD